MQRMLFQPTYQAQMISGAPDPTRAFTAASEAFGKISDNYLKQEALEREQARWDQEHALREQAATRDADLFGMKKEEYEHGKQQREAQKALMPAIADINSAVLGTDQGLLQQFNDSAIRAADRVQKAVFDSDAGLKKDWDALTKDREKATPDQLKALDQREAVLRDRFSQGASKLGATLDQAATAALEGFTSTREQANRAVMQMAANSGYDLDPASLDALLARNKDTLSTRKELQAEQAAIAKEYNDIWKEELKNKQAERRDMLQLRAVLGRDAAGQSTKGSPEDLTNINSEGNWAMFGTLNDPEAVDFLQKNMLGMITTGRLVPGVKGAKDEVYRLDKNTASMVMKQAYLDAKDTNILGTSVTEEDIDARTNKILGDMKANGLLVERNGVLTLKSNKDGTGYDQSVIDYYKSIAEQPISSPVKSQTVDQIQRSALTAPFERLGGAGSRLPAPNSTQTPTNTQPTGASNQAATPATAQALTPKQIQEGDANTFGRDYVNELEAARKSYNPINDSNRRMYTNDIKVLADKAKSLGVSDTQVNNLVEQGNIEALDRIVETGTGSSVMRGIYAIGNGLLGAGKDIISRGLVLPNRLYNMGFNDATWEQSGRQVAPWIKEMYTSGQQDMAKADMYGGVNPWNVLKQRNKESVTSPTTSPVTSPLLDRMVQLSGHNTNKGYVPPVRELPHPTPWQSTLDKVVKGTLVSDAIPQEVKDRYNNDINKFITTNGPKSTAVNETAVDTLSRRSSKQNMPVVAQSGSNVGEVVSENLPINPFEHQSLSPPTKFEPYNQDMAPTAYNLLAKNIGPEKATILIQNAKNSGDSTALNALLRIYGLQI